VERLNGVAIRRNGFTWELSMMVRRRRRSPELGFYPSSCHQVRPSYLGRYLLVLNISKQGSPKSVTEATIF
jgi:hypothetical protein